MLRCLLICLIPFVLFAGQIQAAVPEKDLRGKLEQLPYRAEVVPRALPGLQAFPSRSRTCLFRDFDGDGQDEMIRADAHGVVVVELDLPDVAVVRRDLPAEFAQPGQPAFGLAPGPDLNGDGRPEITAIGCTADRFAWHLWVLDGEDLAVVSTTVLPRGRDIRPDGRWDGHYRHAATLPGSPPLLVLTCQVRHDREGRGVLGVDPVHGKILWYHATAGMPRERGVIADDLDSDGRGDIVLTVDTPTNGTGATVNGYSDDEARLVRLDPQGDVRWSTALGRGPGGSDLEIVDLDGDGGPEIATVQWTTPSSSGALRIWNLDGDQLAEYESTLQFTDLAVASPANGTRPELLVGTTYGTMEVFRCEQPWRLEPVLLIQLPTGFAINGTVDLLPETGLEIVVTDKGGRSLILGADYEPLAVYRVNPLSWEGAVETVQTTPDCRELVRHGARRGTLAFHAVPGMATGGPSILVPGLLVGGALVILGGLVWWGRRRNLAPELQGEVRLHLLESLELSRHGNIAPLNTIRRLCFCLRALKSDIGDTSGVHIRLGEILTECQEASLPHLTGIMDRARLADLDSECVLRAERAIATVRQLIHRLAASGDLAAPPEALISELDAAKAEAENSLRDLRHEVGGYFRTDPRKSLTRVLTANKDRLAEIGARVEKESKAMAAAGGSPAAAPSPPVPDALPPGTSCQIDPADLDQVLDNVVANAAEAMRNAPDRRLRIDQRLADGMVLIEVTDTGCGMVPADRERALNTHYSTKNGGGAGLLSSRKILQRYSGQIDILRSRPGHGTTVRISLIAG